MDTDPSRRTQRLMYEAELLLTHAQMLDGAVQQACEDGAMLLASQGLSALVAELAAPQALDAGYWQDMMKLLPEALQERRLLERALLTAEGELYPLHLRIEQQRTGRTAAPVALIATTSSSADNLAQLKSQMVVLRQLANSLREFSRFC